MKLIVLSWILFASIWTFFTMGYDKRQARRKQRRVPENTLWILSIFGGGIGAYIGMIVFRHKTRHTAFRIGFLLLAIIYTMAIFYCLGFTMGKLQIA
ncbi:MULTISPECIES: DUF1294 domain-containing protein [Sporosarcina]|uniref:DUF1294 domain-containing protein n=1 Tax=Sporosarcina contaminans TaxID=633403 RepID=A0ABW3U2Q0_9BACL